MRPDSFQRSKPTQMKTISNKLYNDIISVLTIFVSGSAELKTANAKRKSKLILKKLKQKNHESRGR